MNKRAIAYVTALLVLFTTHILLENKYESNEMAFQDVSEKVNDTKVMEYEPLSTGDNNTKQLRVAMNTGKKIVSRGERRDTMGIFSVSAYCDCVKCCGKTDGITYSGTHVKEGRTIAVDPSVIPIGTTVYIEGVGYRIAEDIGGAIKGKRIDLFFNNHQEALEFGRQKLEVHIVNK